MPEQRGTKEKESWCLLQGSSRTQANGRNQRVIVPLSFHGVWHECGVSFKNATCRLIDTVIKIRK